MNEDKTVEAQIAMQWIDIAAQMSEIMKLSANAEYEGLGKCAKEDVKAITLNTCQLVKNVGGYLWNAIGHLENADTEYRNKLLEAAVNINNSATTLYNLTYGFNMIDDVNNFDFSETTYKQYGMREGYHSPADLEVKCEFEESIIHITTNHVVPNPRTLQKKMPVYKLDLKQMFEPKLISYNFKPEKIVCLVLHHYDKNREYLIRDADNFYDKAITDTVFRKYLNYGDTPEHVQFNSFAIADESAYTEIFLIDANIYISWITAKSRDWDFFK